MMQHVTARCVHGVGKVPSIQPKNGGDSYFANSFTISKTNANITSIAKQKYDFRAFCATSKKERIEEKLKVLNPTLLEVNDYSGGCDGGNLRVVITSPEFEGKTPLQRHRKVMELIADEIKSYHAISIVAEKE